jgi:hypothetical protein
LASRQPASGERVSRDVHGALRASPASIFVRSMCPLSGIHARGRSLALALAEASVQSWWPTATGRRSRHARDQPGCGGLACRDRW